MLHGKAAETKHGNKGKEDSKKQKVSTTPTWWCVLEDTEGDWVYRYAANYSRVTVKDRCSQRAILSPGCFSSGAWCLCTQVLVALTPTQGKRRKTMASQPEGLFPRDAAARCHSTLLKIPHRVRERYTQ